jgi:hypothetical protein
MQRAPAPSKNFVRGKSGHVPFWPGGLEEALGDIDDGAVPSGKSYGLRTIPPGFTRGLRLPGEESDVDDLERMEEGGDEWATQLRPASTRIRTQAPIPLLTRVIGTYWNAPLTSTVVWP